ncbi:B3 domain-containing protein Os07g0563300-like isoform X2 [Mangifera indica]|uniref:B3 domain-containing protein Os07g0563300-like isoform X2 n=1 Tax=Mangifera indica TaxID=29780 RepID=UPI001CF9C0D6|nr:B3 domain-containing protein Os07g0563300-like isoform X2 [Mangifera indica]
MSSSSKFCFNKECKELLKSERPRKGWLLRGGELAELCDRCGSIYEEGRFCDTFHLNYSGWRSCDTCGKQVHCACIVALNAFTLLDDGGMECMACARKNVLLAPNPSWPPYWFYQMPFCERLKDLSVKNWTHLAGSGPVPWRQAPSLFNSSIPQPELHPRVSYEVDLSTGIDRLNTGERLPIPSLEKRKIEGFSERLMNGGLKGASRDILDNGNTGINCDEQPSACLNKPHQSSSSKGDSSTTHFSSSVPYASPNETNGQFRISGAHLRPSFQLSMVKQIHGNSHNGLDSMGETQIRHGRPRVDARGRNQLLPRYWPRFTDQDLQQISGDSNSVITPLFEKMLSASDAGRIGRLVLPKKCAEAYFPPISQPEGLPLRVQDSKGKEWIFQFRFWPNNNSRMYVLEGVTPCIQNMQLQAGDIVTFSRLEPEGKLVMGCRKASANPASDQDNEANKTLAGVSTNGDVELPDPSSWSKVDKSGYIATEALGVKSSISRKRKNTALGSKNKRPKIESEDHIELKLTWEEAQGLLRPPNNAPTVVVIEGYEFEEYEDAPILGKPTLFTTDKLGEKIQWVQCEDCSKWRKMPANAVLPSKWTCSGNTWDPERSFCSAAQELRGEQFEDLLTCNQASSKKLKAAKQEPDNTEALEGLDTLANLAILGEGEALTASSQATTKHPRHRPGCSCIVCIQPPSGKGPKHKQTCTCNVCQTVKRRFHTLMMRREKKQSEKDAESSRKKQQPKLPFPDKLLDDDLNQSSKTQNTCPSQKKMVSEGSDDESNRMKSSTSPFKGQIDLNIQPEREEELSPGADSVNMMTLSQDATERYLRHQILSTDSNNHSEVNQALQVGGTGEKLGNTITLDSSHQDADSDHGNLPMKPSASISANG